MSEAQPDRAYVLHSYPYRETSLILQLWTERHGRFGVVAKGARRPKSASRSVLVAFQPISDTPVFTGAGPGHWDVKIRERGWIMVEPSSKPGDAPLFRLWYTGYDGTRDGLKQLDLRRLRDRQRGGD